MLLIDPAEKVAEKIRISGGGRCNFTNLGTTPAQFLSANPDYCRSALARYTPADFIALVRRHGIAFHEKHKGQLFCDGPAEQIITMLQDECRSGGVLHWQPCAVAAVRALASGFEIDTATVAGYIQGVVAGEKPGPAPLDKQVDLLLRALQRLSTLPHEKRV